jgi:hypothetical protein
MDTATIIAELTAERDRLVEIMGRNLHCADL